MKRIICILSFIILFCGQVYGQCPWGIDCGGGATITQTITDGNTTEAPSSDAVYTALAGKLSTVCTGTLIKPLVTAPTGDCLIPGERYAVHGRLWDVNGDLITITGSGIAAANSNPDTFTDSGNGLIAIKAGMRIYGEDFTNAGNNAEFVAATDATAGSVTLRSDNAVTAEAAGSSRTLYVYNHYWVQRTPEGGWIKLEDERGVISVASYNTVETEYLPISYCIDGTAAPDALATVTSTNGKANVRTFAGDSSEDCYMKWDVPTDIDITSGIKIQIKGVITAATGPSNVGISFDLSGFSLGDGDALNGTFGTVVELDKTAMTEDQYDNIVTGYSAALTATNITNFAAGEQAQIKIMRDHDDEADTYEQLIGIEGIKIKYVRKHDTTF